MVTRFTSHLYLLIHVSHMTVYNERQHHCAGVPLLDRAITPQSERQR
jgi:hypothetical protein